MNFRLNIHSLAMVPKLFLYFDDFFHLVSVCRGRCKNTICMFVLVSFKSFTESFLTENKIAMVPHGGSHEI